MNGFGASSAFGQQSNLPQTPANNASGFGAKRTQSFAGPSTSGGLFGSGTSTGQNNANAGGGGLFGNSAGTQGGSGLLNNAGSNATGTAGGLFGANQTAGNTPFGSGNANNNANNNASTGGLFGSNTTGAGSSGGLFGNTGTANTGGGLFGNKPNTTGGGLFGNTTANNTAGNNASGGGLFGNQSASKPAFGASSGSSLFGKPAASTQPATGGLFGGNNAAPSSGGGLFGGGLNTSNASGGGNLFGNKPSGGLGSSLFGNSSTTGQAPSAPANGGGLFGSNSGFTGSGLNQAQQQPPQQQLMTTIDQASFTLPGVSPSQKLYTSLSSQGTKRGVPDSDIYDYEPKSIVRNKVALPKSKNASASRSSLMPGMPKDTSASISGSLAFGTSLISAKQSIGSTNAQGEPRNWINSYEKFVRERPTTLTIRQEGRRRVTSFLPGPETAPVSTEPPAIANDGNSTIFVNPIADKSVQAELPATLETEPDVSLFHRQANNMTLVRVNKKAVEEGYYIHPRLEDLAAMSKSQLSSVKHLVVGRENFGQIEYPNPVDLSHISNLGDILGTLVVFGPGTVCVYPDEDTKAPPGRELNKPCTVTIENAWPKDGATHQTIKDIEDPRMAKHIQRLRNACESRGGEFVTFAQGVWVFKVPHFSTWGLPADEMIIDDAEPTGTGDLKSNENGASAIPQLTSSPASASALNAEDAEDVMITLDDNSNPRKGNVVVDDKEVIMDSPETEQEYDTDMAAIGQPSTWLEQLVHASNGILLAAAGSLTAASGRTADLNLGDILNPKEKSKGNEAQHDRDNQRAGDEDNAISSSKANMSRLKLSSLRKYIQKQPRSDSNLPRLSTNLAFSDISKFTENHGDLWELLATLFDGESESGIQKEDASRLCSWFDKKVSSSPINLQGDALDTVWQLVARHQIKEASERAVTSNNLHLGLLISILGNRAELDAVKTDAERQLNDWKVTRVSNSIPVAIRRIWELAAGRIPSGTGFSWAQWLGIHLWYFSNSSLKSAVSALPGTYSTSKDPELVFMEFFAGTKQLRTAVNELSIVDAFLCLQAMLRSRPLVVKADLKYYDNACAKLSKAFATAGDFTIAVFVALHIFDSKLATRLTREILHGTPISVTLPLDFGVPEQFLDESRAYQVAQEGEFLAQADYLVRAGLFDDAHNVILATVGPDAVLSGNLGELVNLLLNLEKAKDQIKGWDVGGNVYLMYARSLESSPDQYTVVALCNALRYVNTPSLKSREAVSRIAEWVAATPFASSITSQMILRMKFDPSQARIQTLQEASRLLI